MKKILSAVLFCAITMSMLTSCAIEDNPAPVTDYKPFPYDSEIEYVLATTSTGMPLDSGSTVATPHRLYLSRLRMKCRLYSITC